MTEAKEQQVATPEMSGYRHAVHAVRNAIASEVESITMGEVLLAAGEMTTQERRTCRALLIWVAHRIRSSVGHPASSPTAGNDTAAISDAANEERRYEPNLEGRE